MRNNIITTAIIACMVLLMSSCSSQQRVYRASELSLTPNTVRLNLDLSNLEVVGESTIEVEYRTYLGFIRSIDKVNGAEYNRREKSSVMLNGKSNISVGGAISLAKYKIIKDLPDADFYMPIHSETNKEVLFLGSYTKRVATYRAYKYVTN